MNCFNHSELTAVGFCQDCRKGLCSKCASKYTPPICSQCNSIRKSNVENTIYKELLVTFGFGIFVAYFLLNYLLSLASNAEFLGKIIIFIMLAYTFSGTIAGWKTLNEIKSSFFLFLPLIGWLIYFVFKFCLSSIFGLIMLPIRTFKNIRRLHRLKNIPT